MAEHRFFVPPADLAASASEVVLRGAEHHHLARVLRLKPGAAVSVFDGEGRGFDGILESVAREDSRIRLTAADLRKVEPSFHLTLAQGIPALDRMDLIVQKTTELGVCVIQPIVAARTTARIAHDAEWKRLERWRRISREAARQSGRLRLPEVREPLSWDDYRAGLAMEEEQQRLVFCPDGQDADIWRPGALQAPARARSGIVAVGPEGGWTGAELAAAGAAGFVRMGLGPRVLRTETAGIAAVALVLFLAGELGGASDRPSQP